MKLKRMWPGLCILIVFMLFDVVMVASSSFFSGLFPSSNSDMTLIYSCALAVLGVLIMSGITFLFGRICDHIELQEVSETIGVKVIYALMLIAIFVGGIFYRMDILTRTNAAPTGKLSLFENAQVGSVLATGEYDLFSIVSSCILKFVLFFTGNNIASAFGLQVALFMIFVLLGAATVRLLLGKAAAVVFAAYVSFMPIFVEDLSRKVVGTSELFLVFLGIELLVIAIYLKNASDGNYTSRWFVIWYIFVGIVVGFMTYLDAGTILSALPLLLAAMFMAGDEKHTGGLSFIVVMLSGVVTFFAMIAQEAGPALFVPVLKNWAGYYFHNLNIFSVFWTYTNYKIIYLITFIAMSGVLVGFFRNKNFGRVSPWLLSTILVFIAAPFFGATRMNDQYVVTIFFAFVLACVVSLITLTRKETVYKVTPDEEKSQLQLEAESMNTGTTVVEPERIYVKPTVEASVREEVVKPAPVEPVVKEIPQPVQIQTPAEKEIPQPVQIQTPVEPEKQRFVPDGMVLPTGSEEEMDIDKSKMKMPKFEGKIAVNKRRVADDFDKEKIRLPKEEIKKARPHKTRPESRPEPRLNKKDDFDLPFKEGDDFDI